MYIKFTYKFKAEVITQTNTRLYLSKKGKFRNEQKEQKVITTFRKI
jgi:hypothetical protein